MPTVRCCMAIGVVNGKIYVAGGYDGTSASLNSVEVYDPSSNAWTTGLASMPTTRRDLTAGVVNGILYAVGGYDKDLLSVLNSVEAYTP